MLDGAPNTPTPPPPQTSIALDALQQQQQQQRSYLHYVAHLPSVKATPVSQREQSLLSLVAVENEELARVNDQERVSLDTLSLLALRSAFVLPSGALERRKRRKDKKRSSSKKHTSKKVCDYVGVCDQRVNLLELESARRNIVLLLMMEASTAFIFLV